MSSATPQTPQVFGKCVVCGKIASSRCSQCLKFGTDWMYFCSADHQKITWGMHRRVCGKNSKTFEWPLLSDSEADDLIKMGRDPIKKENGKSTAELFEEDIGLNFELAVKFHREKGGPPIPVSQPTIILKGTAQLRLLRYNLRLSTATSSNMLQSVLCDPFGTMISFENEHCPTIIKPPTSSFPSWPTLQHKLLHCFATVYSGTRDIVRRDMYRVLVRFVVEDAKHFLREEVAKTNPVEARMLVTGLETEFGRFYEDSDSAWD
ncbi:hypothetical protein JCM5353_002738 [Sporobolomyces roseus]